MPIFRQFHALPHVPRPVLVCFGPIQPLHRPPCEKAGQAGSSESCFGKIQCVPFISKKNYVLPGRRSAAVEATGSQTKFVWVCTGPGKVDLDRQAFLKAYLESLMYFQAKSKKNWACLAGLCSGSRERLCDIGYHGQKVIDH